MSLAAKHFEVSWDGQLEPRQLPGDIAIKSTSERHNGRPVAVVTGADWLPRYIGYVESTSLGRPVVPLSRIRDLVQYLVEDGHKVTVSSDLRSRL